MAIMTDRENFLFWCLVLIMIWSISYILFIALSQTYKNDILGKDKNPYNTKYTLLYKVYYMIMMFIIAPLYVIWNLLTRGFRRKWS